MISLLTFAIVSLGSESQSAAYWIAEGLNSKPYSTQVVPGPIIRVRSQEASFSLAKDAEFELQPEAVGTGQGFEFTLANAGEYSLGLPQTAYGGLQAK